MLASDIKPNTIISIAEFAKNVVTFEVYDLCDIEDTYVIISSKTMLEGSKEEK